MFHRRFVHQLSFMFNSVEHPMCLIYINKYHVSAYCEYQIYTITIYTINNINLLTLLLFIIIKCFHSQGIEKIKLHEFEQRLASIETKLDTLNNIPIDKSFLTQTTQSSDKETAQNNKENTLAMMWKFMTIHRRVQATEEAVENIMNILNDMIEDVRQLKKVHETDSKTSEEFDAGKEGSESKNSSQKVAYCIPVSV